MALHNGERKNSGKTADQSHSGFRNASFFDADELGVGSPFDRLLRGLVGLRARASAGASATAREGERHPIYVGRSEAIMEGKAIGMHARDGGRESDSPCARRPEREAEDRSMLSLRWY
jgi:hypothetical protein